MSDHFQTIYARHADQYDRLVSREDYQGNILRVLKTIKPLDDLEVVEMGAGTGRLTRLLSPLVKSVRAYDASQHMLDMAAIRLRALELTNCELAVSDHRDLPAPSASADLAIEGWSFGHLAWWFAGSWREETGKALAEMKRVLRPGGTAIIIETLGTGTETPQAPTPYLADFYSWLENEHGFASTWIRTDYQFESLREAEELTRFFFGTELANRVALEELIFLSECTGVWWLTI
jgi:ubiquinone/menaquinone biosynthesis C-methylase UbiE